MTMRLYKPMTSGGGSFLICVGAALVTGALLPNAPGGTLLLAGFVTGAISIVVTSIVGRLRGIPKPALRDIVLVWIPVVLELAVLFFVMPNFALDARTQMIVVIAIVGAHFLPMAWSFGPLIAWLGLACMGVAAAGQLTPGISLPVLVTIDGLLKMGFGLAMFAGLFRVSPSASLAQ